MKSKKGILKAACKSSKKDGKGGPMQMAHSTPAVRKPGVESGMQKAFDSIKEKAKTIGSAVKEVYSSPEERKKIHLKETLENMSKVKGPMTPFKPMPQKAQGAPMRGAFPGVKRKTPRPMIPKKKPGVPELPKSMPLPDKGKKMPLPKIPNPKLPKPMPVRPRFPLPKKPGVKPLQDVMRKKLA